MGVLVIIISTLTVVYSFLSVLACIFLTGVGVVVGGGMFGCCLGILIIEVKLFLNCDPTLSFVSRCVNQI